MNDKDAKVSFGDAAVDDESNDRLLVMEQGMADLHQWLRMLIAQGLAAQPEMRQTWDHFAARLVDAKLGAIARRIRLLADKIGQPDWPEHLLEEIADLYILCRAFEKRAVLSRPAREDLLTALGLSRRKEDVLQQGSIQTDTWIVVGQSFGQEEKLNRRRTWLLGLQTGASALLLDFTWGNQDFQEQWPVGSCWNAEMAYYPAAFPQRAIAKSKTPAQTPELLSLPMRGFQQLLADWAKAISLTPWLGVVGVLLNNVVPCQVNNAWVLHDDLHHTFVPLHIDDQAGWQLMALGAGHPVGVFGEWDGARFTPLTLVGAYGFVSISVW